MQPLATRINGPVAVIGDVHGQVDKLITVLDRIRSLPDFERRWLVFIGDLVDRGPDPKGALDLFHDLRLQHPRTTAIAGNHELAMAASLELVPTRDPVDWGKRWVAHYDAETTFESYGVAPGDLQGLANQLPESHRDFLTNVPWCVEHPHLLFVHAGIETNTPFELQMRILKEKDFSLNRPPWLCSKSLVSTPTPRDCPFTVVSGHVRVPHVQFGQKRVLLDTTGGYEGDLSCVLFPEKKVITSGRSRSSRATAGAGGGKSWWKIW